MPTPISTYTWIGNAGSAVSAGTPSNWSPAGPPGGGSDVIVNAGTLLLPLDPQLTGNTVFLQNATLVLYGDTLTSLNAPTFDSATEITTGTSTLTTAFTTALDAYGIFINEGSIQADGPAGSQFTIAVAGTTINSVFVPGTLINDGRIEVDAGNAMTIAVSGTSDLFDAGTLLVDGGTLTYSATSVAVLPSLLSGSALTLIEANGTLTQTANATIGAAAGVTGSATVETGGLWNIGFAGAQGLTVGQGAAGSLSVTGGTVELGSSGLAIGSGAAGTVTVSGAGSRLVDAGGMSVGKTSAGTLDVLNGGTVEMSGVSGITVGNSAGSTGTLVVSGTDAGSGLAALLKFDASAKGITVGNAGAGVLSVGAGGTIQMTGTGGLAIGSGAGVTGSVTVTGAGALINLGTTSGGFSIGQSGTGVVAVGAGGTIALNGTNGIGIATGSGSSGTLTVFGTGSLLTLGTKAGGIAVGQGGTGSLTVQGGGSIAIGGTGDLGIATVTGVHGAVLVGGSGSGAITEAGSAAAIDVGSFGTGLLDIEAGGFVSTASGLYIGSSGNGTVMVNGGTLTDSGNLNVAGSGTGTLAIGPNGQVFETGTSGINLGLNVGSHGTLLVSGGTLTATHSSFQALTVGQQGTGSIDIAGTLGLAGVVNAGTSTVVLGNSSGSSGYLTAENGGTLLAGALSIAGPFSGSSNGSASIGSGGVAQVGSVTVGAGGSLSVSGGTLTSVGQIMLSGLSGNAASLSLNAGTISAAGLQFGTFTTSDATGRVTGGLISLTGTTGFASGLNIGSGGTGSLDIEGPGSVFSAGGVILGNAFGTRVSAGTLTLGSGGALTDASQISLNQGTLAIGIDAVVTETGAQGVDVAFSAGSQGTILIHGGTLNAGFFVIGQGGTGSLDLACASGVSGVLNLGTGSALLGAQTGSSGKLTVDNGGTLIAGALDLAPAFGGAATAGATIAAGGVAQIGSAIVDAGGTLAVTGGTLTSTGPITLSGTTGNAATLALTAGTITTENLQIAPLGVSLGTPAGTVEVTGGLLDVTGTFALSQPFGISVGANGAGGLDIDDTGSVIAQGGVFLGGTGSADIGLLTVENNGVLTDVGALTVTQGTVAIASGGVVTAASLSLGSTGTTELTVGGGGLFSATGTNQASIGGTLGGTASVTVTGGIFSTSGAPLFIGNGGNGSLLVQDGGTVTTSSGVQGPVVDINAAGSAVASATITLGALWQITGTSGFSQVIVGDTGQGLLTVGQGGLVNAGTLTVDVGNQTGGAGTIAVQAGGVLEGGNLAVGSKAGSGLVSIAAGGTVDATGLAVSTLGTLDLTGGMLVVSSPLSRSSGLIEGFGMLAGQLDNFGSVLATGGTLEVTGGISGSGSITLAGSAGLQVDGALGNSLTVTFATGGPEILDLGAPNVGDNGFAIQNWQNGDEVAFSNGATITGAQWLGGGTLAVASSIGTYDFTNVSLGALTFPIFTTGTNFVELISCFAAGTRIRTPDGDVDVETLAAGDLVCTALHGEPAPVVWIGHRRVNCAAHPKPPRVWPVRVSAGAFGLNLPMRDLMLSPDHAVYVDGVLIPVRRLINGTTIAQVPAAQVAYYHVELSTHDVIFAEGLPTESYLDVGQRDNFANNAGPVRLYPDFAEVWEAEGCAPLMVFGPAVDAVRAMIAGRAAAAG
jgi:T5SS/PEP-CTERM-associated repeat protein